MGKKTRPMSQWMRNPSPVGPSVDACDRRNYVVALPLEALLVAVAAAAAVTVAGKGREPAVSRDVTTVPHDPDDD